jgi:ketosteroid isomerase-like protein
VPIAAMPNLTSANEVIELKSGHHLKVVVLSCLVLLPILASAGEREPTLLPQLTPRPDCADQPYRQFDFWIGDWDAFGADGSKLSARVKVTPILGGCALHEEYLGVDGLKGESFSTFSPTTGSWQQTWVTNRGQRLVIEGGWEAGQMKLVTSKSGKAARELVRGVWKPVGGSVRETAWKSTDGGKTWPQWFDLIFLPHKEGNMETQADDAKEVAELDRIYQAAVEKNDAETMDRILSDDFLIVTGSGKRHTKEDLLAEARSKQIIYERQDDSEKTVRVYGDTAIVTAKLFAKGTDKGEPFEYSLWFTDIYRRIPKGWRYVYAQSSLRLPNSTP